MDTMLTFGDDKLSTKFLTRDELLSVCPMAFKDSPTNPKVSNRYIQANTMTVVDDLAKLGWLPVEAKQCRGKKGSSGIRSFHMICFQNPNVKIVKNNPDGSETIDAFPRIILTNSHDGFNSFKFMVGLFRLVCSNGLVVASQKFADMAIKHINYDFEQLRKIVKTTIEEIPNITFTMNEMKKVELTEEQKNELATEVVKIRKNMSESDKLDIDKMTIMEILVPNREEDLSNDLWTVFNVCQEKLIRGGYSSLNSTRKSRKQRSITSVRKDLDYNKRLWESAMRFMPSASVANV